MVDWNFQSIALTVPDLWDRVNRLVQSLRDVRDVKGKGLAVGFNRIAHGSTRGIPSQVLHTIVGESASTAIVTRGAIDSTHVELHATAVCTVDLVVYGSP